MPKLAHCADEVSIVRLELRRYEATIRIQSTSILAKQRMDLRNEICLATFPRSFVFPERSPALSLETTLFAFLIHHACSATNYVLAIVIALQVGIVDRI